MVQEQEEGQGQTEREEQRCLEVGEQQQEQYMEQGVQRIRNPNQGLHLLVHPIPPMFPL